MASSFSNSRGVAWMVWIIVSIFYAYQYILRVMPNIMLHDIMQQFHISASTFGQFSGIYYIGYSLVHLPIGILLDRFGPRRVMPVCILMTVVGLMPLLFAEHWMYPILGRFLIGMGSSAAILGLFKIVRMVFIEKHFSRMLSLSVTIGVLGAIYGGGPVSYMREILGYDMVIKVFCVVGIMLAFITYWIIPPVKSLKQAPVKASVKEVLSNGKVLLACVFAGLMVGPLEGFADVWGTVFLKKVYGLEGSLASGLPSMIFIGMCFGAPLLSFIAEKVGSNLTTIVGAGIAMSISFFVILLTHLTSGSLSINFVLIGICCGYQILAIYKVSTYVREEVAGLATALANMIIMAFGYAFHSSMGGIVSLLGGPEVRSALFMGVLIVPVALCIGTMGFIVLLRQEKKETVKAL